MKEPEDIRPLQPFVAAENRGDEPACAEPFNPPVAADRQTGCTAPVESPQPVEALVPLAELRNELMRRISEARTRQGVAMHYERPYSLERAMGQESALFDLYKWLIERATAKGTGGNDPSSATRGGDR